MYIRLFGLPIHAVATPTECHFQWRLHQSEHQEYRSPRRLSRV